MKCSEVIEILGKLAPESCACDWDNPGLLAGRSDKEVKKIYIALDATDQVVDAAIKAGADMLLTHHPLIFKAIKKVNDQNFITRRLVKLIQADISYYAMGDMEINGNSVAYGIGKTGNLAEKLTVKALAEKVKQAFDLPFVLVYGEELMDMEVEKVALCPGAGGSVIEEAIHAGAKALVTGDISHHQGIDAAARNMAVIDAGHYGMEHIFIQYMAGYLKENLPVEMEIVTAPSAWPTVLL